MQTISNFAHGLLTHEELIIDAVSMTVVTSFDHELFSKKCSPSSLYYDANLSDYNALLPELINVGQVLKSRDLLLSVLNAVAKQHGWKTQKNGVKIICNRFGTKRIREGKEKDLQAGHLGSWCPFEITFKAKKEKCVTGDTFVMKRNMSQPITISRAHLVHGGHCQPSRSNLIAVTKAAGAYSSNLPQKALFSLCAHADSGRRLSKDIISSVLRPVWPSKKKTSATVTCSMCV